jgi:hypothetical protein
MDDDHPADIGRPRRQRRSNNVAICCGCLRPVLCRFLDAGDDEPLNPLIRPASEKRQGTKSRSVGQRRCRRRYGD